MINSVRDQIIKLHGIMKTERKAEKDYLELKVSKDSDEILAGEVVSIYDDGVGKLTSNLSYLKQPTLFNRDVKMEMSYMITINDDTLLIFNWESGLMLQRLNVSNFHPSYPNDINVNLSVEGVISRVVYAEEIDKNTVIIFYQNSTYEYSYALIKLYENHVEIIKNEKISDVLNLPEDKTNIRVYGEFKGYKGDCANKKFLFFIEYKEVVLGTTYTRTHTVSFELNKKYTPIILISDFITQISVSSMVSYALGYDWGEEYIAINFETYLQIFKITDIDSMNIEYIKRVAKENLPDTSYTFINTKFDSIIYLRYYKCFAYKFSYYLGDKDDPTSMFQGIQCLIIGEDDEIIITKPKGDSMYYHYADASYAPYAKIKYLSKESCLLYEPPNKISLIYAKVDTWSEGGYNHFAKYSIDLKIEKDSVLLDNTVIENKYLSQSGSKVSSDKINGCNINNKGLFCLYRRNYESSNNSAGLELKENKSNRRGIPIGIALNNAQKGEFLKVAMNTGIYKLENTNFIPSKDLYIKDRKLSHIPSDNKIGMALSKDRVFIKKYKDDDFIKPALRSIKYKFRPKGLIKNGEPVQLFTDGEVSEGLNTKNKVDTVKDTMIPLSINKHKDYSYTILEIEKDKIFVAECMKDGIAICYFMTKIENEWIKGDSYNFHATGSKYVHASLHSKNKIVLVHSDNINNTLVVKLLSFDGNNIELLKSEFITGVNSTPEDVKVINIGNGVYSVIKQHGSTIIGIMFRVFEDNTIFIAPSFTIATSVGTSQRVAVGKIPNDSSKFLVVYSDYTSSNNKGRLRAILCNVDGLNIAVIKNKEVHGGIVYEPRIIFVDENHVYISANNSNGGSGVMRIGSFSYTEEDFGSATLMTLSDNRIISKDNYVVKFDDRYFIVMSNDKLIRFFYEEGYVSIMSYIIDDPLVENYSNCDLIKLPINNIVWRVRKDIAEENRATHELNLVIENDYGRLIGIAEDLNTAVLLGDAFLNKDLKVGKKYYLIKHLGLTELPSDIEIGEAISSNILESKGVID